VDRGHEEGFLGWLDSPRLVVGAFAFFLLGLAVLGILLWTDQQKQTDRLDAVIVQRLREERAAKTEQVGGCFQRATQGPALQRVLLGLAEGHATQPQLRDQLRDFARLNALNTPTLRECRQLAADLNVPIPKGVR
jgi:hypothetical protein